MSGKPAPYRLNLFLLWQAQFLTVLGNSVMLVAMIFWVKHNTGSATLLGLLTATITLPGILLAPLGGAVADILPRKKILAACDLINAVLLLTLSYLLFHHGENTQTIITALFCICLIAGATGAFFGPAVLSIVPDIAADTTRIQQTNSLLEGTKQIASLLGQGTGAILYRLLGTPVIALIDGLLLICSAILESLIRPRPKPANGKQKKLSPAHVLANVKEGFAYILAVPGLRIVFLSSAVLNFFVQPIHVLLPFYVEDTLGLTVDWYGALFIALGTGSISGFILAGAMKIAASKRDKVIIASLLLLSASLAALGAFPHLSAALAAMFLTGLMSGFINIHIITILQTGTKERLRGQVFGYLITLSGALAPLGAAIAGVLADLLNQNIPLLYMLCGGVMALIVLLFSLSSDYRLFLKSGPLPSE